MTDTDRALSEVRTALINHSLRPFTDYQDAVQTLIARLDAQNAEIDRLRRYLSDSDKEWFGKLSAADAEIERLRADLERERMRLAACGVVALADTPESAKKARDMLPEYRSASCDDVARRVDQCMKLRAAVEILRSELDNIESANPRQWDADVRDQFQWWAQSRARAALRLADAAMGNDVERAG